MKPLYDKRQANRISFWVVVAAAIAIAAYVGLEQAIDPVSTGDSGLRVRSLFGFGFEYSDIRDMELVDQAAPLGARIMAFDAFGLFREGRYQVEGIGPSSVYLRRPDVSYIHFRTDRGDYLVSLGAKDKDQLLYDRIKSISK
jgi:hypothetical protein